jgi:hypothetical protein
MRRAIKAAPVVLSDGRIVKVSEYPDGSIRVSISGSQGLRYAITSAFIPGTGQECNFTVERLLPLD